jgi:hypothetical protein
MRIKFMYWVSTTILQVIQHASKKPNPRIKTFALQKTNRPTFREISMIEEWNYEDTQKKKLINYRKYKRFKNLSKP